MVSHDRELTHPVDRTVPEMERPVKQINLHVLFSLLVSSWKPVAGVTVVVTMLAMVWLLLLPNRYTSRATILPSGQSEGVTSLKDLVGLGSIGMADENSSALFPLILRSTSVKDSLLRARFQFRHDAKEYALSLTDYFEETDQDRLYQALDAITTIETGKRTGEIGVAVETIYPELSKAILTTYLNLLEDYNLNRRQSTARNNQDYLARQVTQTSQELAVAENELTSFRLVNRDWAGSSSPEIVAELTRLQRNAEIKSTALLYLQQQYEIAKFNAQKDVPIVRLLDPPSLPTMKSGPFRARLLMLIVLGTLAVCLCAVVGWHGYQQLRLEVLNESGRPESPLRGFWPRQLRIKRHGERTPNDLKSVEQESVNS